MLAAPVRYATWYPWFVLLASLDVMLTWTILRLGGREANVIAEQVIDAFGLPGAIALKFGSVIVVVLVCEYVGRQADRAGRRLAATAVALSVVPVLIGAGVLVEYAWIYTLYAP